MTEAWKEQQLWQLACFHELRRRELDPSLEFEEYPQPGSSQVAMLQIFEDALNENITPVKAAERIADWVLSVPDMDVCYDIDRAYYAMIRALFAGASQLSCRKHLKILADFTVELANLPDVYNNTDRPMEFEGGSVVVQPGERIKLPCDTGGSLWSGLPDFGSIIGGDLDGGPSDFFRHSEPGHDDQQQIHREAEKPYTNINTFAALIAQQHPPQGSPLCSCLHNAFAVFAFLEYGPDTPRGEFSHLVVRAAATWLTIAGEELVSLGSPSVNRDYISGSLWAAEGGTNTVDVKRLQFWKERFRQLRESGRLLSQEAVDATIDAAAALDKLIAARG
ncbi:hypothetical protein P153DRAFT_431948 [Dothidotthia symphoricarpi CBS 119687]|uniref:Uncharacterized protein n=1 Tax=Dothidotthia symphoricarpi CBS 119687 TaxID=1392245 RepID=A0A6A6AD49_9PLEO|nr:uncharacterized protein P153DRAFT_431948 [Dothidotthia symphoricarpi CBS 119687]KAF2129193.1 hypothetical protein P153DRAFT_431948 [Dothidotthia symphoricarpi CBS 119687]